jgi:hypothetical protein
MEGLYPEDMNMKIHNLNIRIVTLFFAGLVVACIFVMALVAFALIPSQPRQPDPVFSQWQSCSDPNNQHQ